MHSTVPTPSADTARAVRPLRIQGWLEDLAGVRRPRYAPPIRRAARPIPHANPAPAPRPASGRRLRNRASLVAERWSRSRRRAYVVAFDLETTVPIRARPNRSVSRWRRSRGARATSPSRIAMPARPISSIAPTVLARSRPGWRDASAKVGQNLKFAEHAFANHGSACAASRTTRWLESYVLESHKPHDLDKPRVPPSRLADDRLRHGDGDGRRSASRSTRSRSTSATEYAGRERRRHAAPARNLARGSSATRSCRASTRRSSCRCATCCSAWSARRADRSASLAAHEPRPRRARQRARAGGVSARRHAVQPRLARAAMRDPVRADEAAGRARRRATGQPSTDEDVLQELAASYPLPKVLLDWRAAAKLQVDVHRQAAGDGQRAHRRACIRRSRRRPPSPAGSRRPSPTCRTFRCAPSTAGASARRSSRRPGTC